MFDSPLAHLASMFFRNDDSPFEGGDKCLTRVKREQCLLNVKDSNVDLEKDQANTTTRQHSHQQSVKGLI